MENKFQVRPTLVQLKMVQKQMNPFFEGFLARICRDYIPASYITSIFCPVQLKCESNAKCESSAKCESRY